MSSIKGVRYRELDSLRGLAACSVVLGHFASAYVNETVIWHGSKLGLLRYGVTMMFTSGHQAVLLFFLLSGFVLSLPAVNNKPQRYHVFLIRRFFRIYVPYLAGLALSVLGNLCWHGPLGLSRWADHTWAQPVHWRAVLHHILFFGQYDQAQFNTALWTLIIAMRISIVFPLLCYIVLRVKPWISIALVIVNSIAVTYFQIKVGFNAYELTLNAAGYFVIGILLARHKTKLITWASSLSKGTGAIYMAAALLVYWYGALTTQVIAKVLLKVHNPRLLGIDWVSGFGAVLLIVLSLGYAPFSRVLLTRFPQFMGKIFYSVYLVHGTVLFALLHALSGRIPPAVIFLIYIPMALLLSMIMYKLVEKPSMDFGRRITRTHPIPTTPAVGSEILTTQTQEV
jgi:peptidoglycan/LPS O-acetylase OafA/YrhL